jgi:hypothetical protein
MPETAEEKTAREQAEADAAKAKLEAEAQAATDAAAAAAKAKADTEPLGDGGKAALDAERKLRRDAEKQAKDAKARLDALEAEKLSDTEKLQKRADDAEASLLAAISRVRDANLTQALAAAGVAHPKAAARLLDGVKFDDASHEPTNLDDALKAAKASYGDEMFKPARPTPAGINPGAGGGGGEGPVLTAEELAAAKGQGMTPDEWAYYRDNPAAQAAYEPAKT